MAAVPYSITPRPLLHAAAVPAVLLTTLVLSPDLTARLLVGTLGLLLFIGWLCELQREREALAEAVAAQVALAVAQDSLALYRQLLANPDMVQAALAAEEE